jgi:hypothetical protein
MKELMYKLIQWYKDNHYSQGDDYYVSYSPSTDLWSIGYLNDYPMQHGKEENIRLNSTAVDNIIK